MTYKRRNALRAFGDFINNLVHGEDYQEKIEQAETQEQAAFIEAEASNDKAELIAEFIEKGSIY
jgi:hypothetical protein